ncbi:MAG: O-antigen ligase family protein [Moraxellaceae bacterium]|nr:O-antigen ligase family protein [Moraxellaceae bacterium]
MIFQFNQKKISFYLAIWICSLFSFCSLLIWSGYTILSTESYNEWRFFEVLILFSLSIYYFFIPVEDIKYKSSSVFSVALILVLGCISCLNAEYVSRAFRDWSLYGCLFFGTISLSHIIYKYPKISFYTLVFLCSTPIFFIIEFLYQIFFYLALPITDKVPVTYTWTGQFNNPRLVGDTILPILFMIIALLTRSEIHSSGTYKIIFQFLLASLCIIVMFSGGRGILLSMIFSILFFYAFIPKVRPQLKKISIYGTLCFVIGLLLLLIIGDNNNTTVARQDSSGRVLLIEQSIKYLQTDFFLGIGPGQFPPEKVPVSHPHNLFIQFMTEWGIIAGFCLIILLVVLAYKAFKTTQKTNSFFNIFICLSVFSFILNCNFNGAHIYPSSQIYGLFSIAFLLSTYIYKKDDNSPKPSLIKHNLIKNIQFGIAIVLLYTAYLALGCGNIVTSQQFIFGPRFWLYDSIHSDNVCPPANTFFNKSY